MTADKEDMFHFRRKDYTILSMRPVQKAFFAQAFPIVLLLGLVFQVGSFILLHSNTIDELAYIGSGVSYIQTGRLDIDIFEHPPLMKYLIGISLLPVSRSFPSFSEAAQLGSYRFGYEFLYHHPTVKPEVILAFARLPSLLLSLLLAAFIFSWAFRWYGEWGGILSLAAYCLEPNIIVHSGLATFDLGLTCLLFIAAYFLALWIEQRKLWQLIASGVLAGCAIAIKIPGLIFFLWAPCLLVCDTGRKSVSRWKMVKSKIGVLFFLMLISFVVVLLIYQVRYFPDIFELFRYRLHQTFFHESELMDPVFLHGAIRTGGWRSYFLLAFLVKTTISFLLLSGWAFFAGRDTRHKAILLIPVLSYFFFCSMATTQGGLRYLLPIFPFLCVLIGELAKTTKSRLRSGAVGVLFVWSALESVFIFPNYVPYFNELIGGPGHGYEWFWDSNVDWGQDYAKIGDYLRKQGSPEVIFASPFNADRNYYLGQHQDLLGPAGYGSIYFQHINSPKPSRELLVISATMVQGVLLNNPKTFSWLLNKRPIAMIGYTTFVYDVTRDAYTHFLLGSIYARNENYAYALREFHRAALLAPRNLDPITAIHQTISLMKRSHGHN